MPFIQNLPDGIFIQECNEFDGWSRQDLLDEIKRLKMRINELEKPQKKPVVKSNVEFADHLRAHFC